MVEPEGSVAPYARTSAMVISDPPPAGGVVPPPEVEKSLDTAPEKSTDAPAEAEASSLKSSIRYALATSTDMHTERVCVPEGTEKLAVATFQRPPAVPAKV